MIRTMLLHRSMSKVMTWKHPGSISRSLGEVSNVMSDVACLSGSGSSEIPLDTAQRILFHASMFSSSSSSSSSYSLFHPVASLLDASGEYESASGKRVVGLSKAWKEQGWRSRSTASSIPPNAPLESRFRNGAVEKSSNVSLYSSTLSEMGGKRYFHDSSSTMSLYNGGGGAATHATTVVCVRKNGEVVVMADGNI